jgi:hypothetical protein
MVSDYESRLEEAYYATCAVKGALKWAIQPLYTKLHLHILFVWVCC